MTPPAAILALFDQARAETRETARVTHSCSIVTANGQEYGTLEISHGIGTDSYVAQFTASAVDWGVKGRHYEHSAIGASVTEAADNMRHLFEHWWATGEYFLP